MSSARRWRRSAVLGNYDITSNTASFDIAKKAASVTPNAAGKTYGDADPAFSGTLAGFLAADGVTATYTRTAGETVGAYVISATLAPVPVLGNYDITSNTASFDIAKKAASVTPNAAGKIYGTADPVLSGTLAGFLAADSVTATYSRTAGETVGAYVISATLAPVPVLGNYDITSNTAAFTVSKATLTVTADNKTKLLNAPNPTMTASYSGFVNEDTLASAVTGTPDLVTTAVTTSPVGTYPITASVGTLSAQNYAFVFANGTLSVLYRWDGFLQPINDTAHDLGNMSRFKLGQTVPAKFDLKDTNGIAVLQTCESDVQLRLDWWVLQRFRAGPDRPGLPGVLAADLYAERRALPVQLEHERGAGWSLPHLRQTERRHDPVRRHLPLQVG